MKGWQKRLAALLLTLAFCLSAPPAQAGIVPTVTLEDGSVLPLNEALALVETYMTSGQ